jgi:hypothetical protein
MSTSIDGGLIVATTEVVDWAAVSCNLRVRSLQRRKSLFLWGLLALKSAAH